MPRKGKFVASIEARVGSSRLPAKVLRPILGRPMLELMIERVKKAKEIDEILIATTVNPNDDALEELALRMGVKCYRGSEEDVLLRVLEAAHSVKADHIVEMWGDTPLMDPAIVDRTVGYYKSNNFDCVGNHEGYPWCTAMLVFPTALLDKVNVLTQDPVDRENVSTYINKRPETYKLSTVSCPPQLRRPELKLTVDVLADFEVVTRIFEHFGPQNLYFDLGSAIKFLDEHPEIKDINKQSKQKVVDLTGKQ